MTAGFGFLRVACGRCAAAAAARSSSWVCVVSGVGLTSLGVLLCTSQLNSKIYSLHDGSTKLGSLRAHVRRGVVPPGWLYVVRRTNQVPSGVDEPRSIEIGVAASLSRPLYPLRNGNMADQVRADPRTIGSDSCAFFDI